MPEVRYWKGHQKRETPSHEVTMEKGRKHRPISARPSHCQITVL